MSQQNCINRRPLQGVGVGLRSCHYQHILQHKPDIPWFEILSDNYLMPSGPELRYLDAICEEYPVVMHGVGMSIGSTDALDKEYLKKIKQLAQRTNAIHISDHLCWVSVDQTHLHDLLPLPYTEEAINHVVDRIKHIQDYLGQRILIENVSSYLEYKHSAMPEWEFINAIAEQADCYIVLDVNNIYVSAHNHQFNSIDYIQAINPERVKQYHLAGFSDRGDYLFDTHSETIHPPVWDLYEKTLNIIGDVPTLIEWDDHIPPFVELEQQVAKARLLMDSVVCI